MAKTLAELWQDMDDTRRQSAALKAARIGSNIAMQADAAVRGAANVLTFGLADKAAALADTKLHPGSEYGENLEQQAARNAHDHDYRRPAQLLGELAGTGVALGVAGPNAVLARAARLPGVARITARETTSALGAGAVGGAGMQGLGDLATGQRGTPGDYLGAAAGGAVGIAALPFGARRAGALSGGTTSAVQDLLNGRAVSPDALQRSATAGAVFGGLGARLGGHWSNSLSSKAKGDLGEAMGGMRSVADWEPRDMVSKTREQIPEDIQRRYIYPDGRRGTTLYEDKFGPTADLTNNQKLMRAARPEDFRLNHFLPRDVGMVASVPASAAGVQIGQAGWPYHR